MVVAKLFRSSSVAFVAHCYCCPVVVYVDDGLCFCGLLFSTECREEEYRAWGKTFFDDVDSRRAKTEGRRHLWLRRYFTRNSSSSSSSPLGEVPRKIRAARFMHATAQRRPTLYCHRGKAFLVPYPGPRHAVLGQKNTSTTTDITGHFCCTELQTRELLTVVIVYYYCSSQMGELWEEGRTSRQTIFALRPTFFCFG